MEERGRCRGRGSERVQKTFQSRTELMSLFVLGVRVPMYLLQAARDADGEGRRRRSPSSCLVCAESPEMLEMKLGLSISSGLIAYLPG